MKNIQIFVFLFLYVGISQGQSEQEGNVITELIIVDTNNYNGKPIYVFNDGSWEYASEFKVVEVMKSKVINQCLVIDTSELFTKNWRNHKTFSLDHNLKGAIDSIYLSTSGFIKPVDHPCNSEFKIRWGKWHQGNDYACKVGTPVKAAWSGKVRYAQMNNGGFGNLIIIRHYNGLETYYAHLSGFNVKINQTVSAGDVIGYVGNTGHSSGSHLHFEVRFLDNPINPRKVMESDKLLICSSTFESMKATNKEVKIIELFSIKITGEAVTEKKEVLVKEPRKRRRTSSNMD